jgi:hypothetical protein
MATIANLKVNLLADSTGLNKSLADATAKMQAFGTKMSEIGSTMSTRLTLPIVGIGAAMVKAASDAEETATKFAVVFRDVEQGAQQAFKTLRDEYGLSTAASKELLGNTGDLLTGFGFSQQAALELSTEVNKLAVDLASFTNFSGGAKGASEALTKALLGERESVKSLGISILEEDVQKQVAINTTNGLTFASERQAKAYATLQIAQSQSKNAIGDYARTQDGLANQTRLLQQRLNDLSVSFGEIMVPAVNDVVGRLVEIVEKFRDLDTETKKIILGIAGIVAVVGPTLYAIGKLTTAISTLTLAMAKNPATAIAIGLLAIATAAYIAIKSVGDLESALLKQAGVSALTGSEDERKRLNDLKNQLKDEKKILEDRKKLSQSFQTREQLQIKIDVIQGDISAIDQAIAKSNILAFETEQLAESAKEAQKAFDDLSSGLSNSTGEVVHASGSINALEADLESLNKQFGATGDAVERANLDKKVRELTAQISYLKAVAKAGILPADAPVTIDRATVSTQRLTTSLGGLSRGFIPLATAPETITQITAQMRLMADASFFANEMAYQFTNSFSAGLADLIVHGGKLKDMLRNIGNLLASSAFQLGIQMLLMGATGQGGAFGFIKNIFKPQVASVPTQVMGAGMMSVSGSFKVQGTDLIAVINRSERQLR